MKRTKQILITGPCVPVNFSIYKITIGDYVYVGHTRDIYDRAKRHATDTRRIVGAIFANSTHPMIVEHLCEACTKEEAREFERQIITSFKQIHKHKLLNVHHAKM